MTLRTTQVIVPAGTAPTFSAATTSDTMDVGERLFAVYRSTHSSAQTLTVVIPGTLESGDAYPDKTYTLPIGSVTMSEVWIPLQKVFRDTSTGFATITVTTPTALTMAVVRR